MAKKSKRARAKFKFQQSAKEQQNIRAAQTAQQPAKPRMSEVRPFTPSYGASSASWQEQYKYINPELIRIGIIAAAFFVIIIILSFLPLDKIFFK